MRLLQDALERELSVPETPARIVSLVPSLTELLFDLGAGPRVVAVSRYCSEPAGQLDALPRVGGQKDPEVARIIALAPDLVLAVKEENHRRDVDALEAAGIAVYVADVRTLEDAVALIGEIGDLVDGEPARCDALRERVRAGIAVARLSAAGRRPVRVFCPVWRDPWMACSTDTFMHEVLAVCGAIPVLAGNPAHRYPKVTLEQVRAARPEAILLPDEPYAFGPADVAELAAIAPAEVVDGKVLQWYGGRTAGIAALADAVARLAPYSTRQVPSTQKSKPRDG